MACTIRLPWPHCVKCAEPAKVELLGRDGRKRGTYCETCGDKALRSLHAEELASSSPRANSDSKPPGRMVGADRGAP